jgi:isopenicillin-N epimerase
VTAPPPEPTLPGLDDPALADGPFWALDPTVTFLNHGSFGACPRPVLRAQQAWRDRMEADPIDFFVRQLEGHLDAARAEVAAFVGSIPEHVAFVPNATTAVSSVLRSLRFEPGDELLANDQEYPSAVYALRDVVQKTGATLVIAPVPFPIREPGQVFDAVLGAVTPRTRLAVISHVTSGTALVFPVAELVRELAGRGVATLIDGAHAPGMLPLALDELGADYYTGNGHKWLSAPKGAAFLHVRPDLQKQIRSLVVSHGTESAREDRSRFWLEFDWQGSHDPSAFLAMPAAIRFLGSLLPGGWTELMAANHALALAGRDLVCERLGVEPPAPDEMLGSMALVPLQPLGSSRLRFGGAEISDLLWERHRIEIPVGEWPNPMSSEAAPGLPRCYARISAQRYNSLGQYAMLADAVDEILASR